ncbi:MAG: hypothetical protein AAF542_19265, partial [Pseudomonadota bacterium]
GIQLRNWDIFKQRYGFRNTKLYAINQKNLRPSNIHVIYLVCATAHVASHEAGRPLNIGNFLHTFMPFQGPG